LSEIHLDFPWFNGANRRMKKLTLSDITTKQLRHAIVIRTRIDSLQQKLQNILGNSGNGRVAKTPGPKRKNRMSAAARARMSAAAKARWRKAKKAGRNSL
jgi:hypothetical protein